MKKIIGFLFLFVIVFFQFGGVSVFGVTDSDGAWYLIGQELVKIELDGVEYPTSGLSGYVDCSKIDYQRLEGSQDVSVTRRRTHVKSGENAIYTVDSVRWTDPQPAYNAGDKPVIVLTRSTVKDMHSNQFKSSISGYYAKMNTDSKTSAIHFYDDEGEAYVKDGENGPTHKMTMGSELKEGEVGGWEKLDVVVTPVAGNAEYAYQYIYHYEWRAR